MQKPLLLPLDGPETGVPGAKSLSFAPRGRLFIIASGPFRRSSHRREEILKFVNERVNRSSRISDVEVEKEPFIKTATLKIKRFLYKEKKEDGSPKQNKTN